MGRHDAWVKQINGCKWRGVCYSCMPDIPSHCDRSFEFSIILWRLGLK